MEEVEERRWRDIKRNTQEQNNKAKCKDRMEEVIENGKSRKGQGNFGGEGRMVAK